MSPVPPNLLVDTGVDDLVTSPRTAAPQTLAAGPRPASVVAAS